MKICVDFDGTIVDHRFPDIGPVVPGALPWMRRWNELGAQIILYTMRSDRPDGTYLKDAIDLLDKSDVKLYGANSSPGQENWTSSPKIYAPVYVDDAAFGCPLIQINGFKRPCVDWSIVGPAIEQILIEKKK